MISTHILSIFFLWLLFYFLHSLLALENLKKYVIKITGGAKTYRIAYNFFFLSFLGFILFHMFSRNSLRLWPDHMVFRYVGLSLSTFGIILVKRSFQYISLRAFLGSNVGKQQLITKGIHSTIRHPMYTATLLFMLGMFLFMPYMSVISMLVSTLIYLPFGIFLEEKKLVKEYGGIYKEYKKNTKALTPWF